MNGLPLWVRMPVWAILLFWLLVVAVIIAIAKGAETNLPPGQRSSGTIQSRPSPARTAKVMESAAHLTRQGAAPDGIACEREGVAAGPAGTIRRSFAVGKAAPSAARRSQACLPGALLQVASAGETNCCGRVRYGARPALMTEDFLCAMERVESGMDAGAVGDHGRARGPFQFWAVTWAQVNSLRSARGLATVPYHTGATNRATARQFASEYLGWLEAELVRSLRRPPTQGELYAAWNLGLSGFSRRGYLVANCPRVTRRAAWRIEQVTILARGTAPASRASGESNPVFQLAGAFTH